MKNHSDMNILVTGANGQLGNEIRIVSAVSADRWLFTDVNEAGDEQVGMLRRISGDKVDVSTRHLDITDIEAVRKFVRENNIGITVNCAAYTNVEAAESNVETAERLNADAPRNLAVAMKEVNGLLVHISTDYVFGKEPYNTPCRETQQGTPTGVYGLTKLHGEKYIAESGCKYVILRTAWLYSEFGKNFCRTMLSLTAAKPSLNVVFDQAGTPTYAYDLAVAIKRVVEDYGCTGSMDGYANGGVYHFSNEGVCSWYDFTWMIAYFSGHRNCRILPCHSDEFPSSVVRPSYSVLDKTKFKKTFGMTVPYWTDSLKVCLEKMGVLAPGN